VFSRKGAATVCSIKTLIKVALGIAAALLLGYVLLPNYRPFIGTAAPYLVLLACPVLMMFMMRGDHGRRDDAGTGRKSPPGG
jgi:uncharacterized membrane protein YgdD (TMEM256/DUF423 family)